MKFFLLLLMSASVFAGENSDTLNEILAAQGKALEQISSREKTSGFKLTEMVTDIGFTKSGVLGLSSSKSYNGIEIKWRKKSTLLIETEGLVIDENTDLDAITDTVTSVVTSSGKIKPGEGFKQRVKNALTKFKNQVTQIEVTRIGGWKASSVRLDLNFSASGELSFITKIGFNQRVRLEWALKDKPLTNPKSALANENTKFVSKILSDLNRIPIPGFKPYKIAVGIGSSVKRPFLSLWKYTAGFAGAVIFVPTSLTASFIAAPSELDMVELEVGGFEDEESEKLFFPWRRTRTVVDFSSGMEQSLKTAASYLKKIEQHKFPNWYVAEVKTVNDISKTGLFGLADVTTKGVIEIDYKKANP